MKAIGVQSLPLHRPVILQKSNTLKQAAQAMKSNKIGSVLVADGNGLISGIFTDRDLALALAIGNMQSSNQLEKATQMPLIYVTETATLKDVVNTMIKFSIRRVPIVHMRPNGKQRCLGIITLDDLIRHNLIDSKEENQILKSQIKPPTEKIGKQRMRSIFHSQDSKEHSYHAFLKTIEKNTNLNRAQAQMLARETMLLVLKRLPTKSGLSLLSQLPHEIQMQLLPNISPLDRSISGKFAVGQIKKRFHVDSDGAKFLLERFWRSIKEQVSPGEFRRINRELPKDFNVLFEESTLAQ